MLGFLESFRSHVFMDASLDVAVLSHGALPVNSILGSNALEQRLPAGPDEVALVLRHPLQAVHRFGVAGNHGGRLLKQAAGLIKPGGAKHLFRLGDQDASPLGGILDDRRGRRFRRRGRFVFDRRRLCGLGLTLGLQLAELGAGGAPHVLGGVLIGQHAFEHLHGTLAIPPVQHVLRFFQVVPGLFRHRHRHERAIDVVVTQGLLIWSEFGTVDPNQQLLRSWIIAALK